MVKFARVVSASWVLLLWISLPAPAQLRITEFMASNTRTLADENGSFEDWIEIQNISSSTVNLFNWSLTDSSGNLTKWRFPATNLPSGGFLVVFASNKDRRIAGAPLHTNFKLDAAGDYLALVDATGTNVVTAFTPKYPAQVPDVSYGFALTVSNVTFVGAGATAGVLVPTTDNFASAFGYKWTGDPANEPYDTSAWSSGATGVGFGAGGSGDIGSDVQSSMLNNNSSAFLRLPFVVSNPANFSLLQLRLKYDDGYVAWLNGVLVAQANAPVEDLDWNSSALSSHSAAVFETILLGSAGTLLRPGTNILAIQGLNVSATNSSFLILPELIGVTVAGETSGLYFTTPTPGADNLGGALAPGPGIADVRHTPNVPLDNDNLVVTARVFPTARAVANVALHYRVMFNTEVTVSMLDDGAHGDGAAGDGVFGATIPANASTSGQMVRYYVTAADNASTTSRLPVFNDPAATAEYFGTVVNPGYVTSALPVVHIFAPASVLQPGPTTSQTGADSQSGGRVSLFFDGEFYDNIGMQVRGNTTAGLNKKSHRLEFNKEHPFRHTGPGGRIRKTSFLSDYVDPAYMRQGLSFWLADQVGAPAPFCIPMRLQLNGAFYQLANHSDVQGEEMLERFGYNPNGAYYANVGQVVPSGASTGGFEKKTRLTEGNADYQALANAISESLSTGQRMTNLFDRLDVPEVINYLVAARFTHQNDDVWANMALYHDNDGDDLWRALPYDQNLSWGAAYMDASAFSGIQSTNDDLKSFPLYGSSQALPSTGGSSWNRIYDVMFRVPQTREMFRLRRMRTMLDTYIKPPGTPSALVPAEQKAIEWLNLVGPDAQRDRAWWGWPGKGGQCNFDPGIGITNGVAAMRSDFIGARRNHLYGKHSITNTALPVGITKTSNAGIALAQPTDAVVAIVGWDYNPASGNQDQEYVQLANANSYAVDVSGWRLKGGIDFKFQLGTVIPADGALYVSPNVRAFRARASGPSGGQGLFVVGPYQGHLTAWGESLTLSDDAGRLVSSNSFAGVPSAAQRFLRITEIMYNPAPAPAITNDEQQFEYVELKNISTNVTLSLTGVRFTNGIYFNFSGSAVTSLAPGQTVLVVRNQAMFTARYGGGFNVAGQFTGVLDNGSETLRLEDAAGEKIIEFAYSDSWYPITDGLGFSLVIVDENAPWNSWDQKSSWRASAAVNGSPGLADPSPAVISPVIVNEVLTHTDLPEVDSVELFNPNTNAVNLGGWYLTDDFYTPKKHRIPVGTLIAPDAYLVITENQFNTGPNAFRFSELGEDVYLFSADGSGNLTGYSQGYSFSAAPNGVSFGRYTNSQGDVHFVLQSAVTLGTNNAAPRIGPVVISEIMYRPPDTNGVDNDCDEFIELQNITVTNVLLYDPSYATNTWRLRNAVDFDFPTGQTLGANARLLVVGFDPSDATQLAAFRAKYGVPATVNIFGPWTGKLDNSGETIELKQPGPPDDTAIVPFYMIDKIAYRDEAPWPSAADGLGNSLQRFANTSFGNDPTNWFAAGATAGRSSIPDIPPTVTITAPTNGAVLPSTNVVISVSANDSDGSVALVQLLANGVEIARWGAKDSNYVWTTAVGGVHEFRARVVDDLGATTESSPVSVTVVSPPPVVALTAPANGAILVAGSSVVLNADAMSGGGLAAFVDYFVDGGHIGSVAPPFSLAWTANPPQYHTLSARARDTQGQVSSESAVTVFVQMASTNPVLIPAGADWRYLDDGSDQGTGWLAPGFPDNSWRTGPAKLGFNNGNNGLGTLLSYGTNASQKHVTYYFRREFVVPTLAGMSNLLLEVQRDDGVALYLNGASVYRNNLPAGTLVSSQLATNASDNGNNWQTATLPLTNLLPGTNLLAAEVHQSSRTSSDIAFDLRLTLLGTTLGPAITGQPQDQTKTNGLSASFSVTAVGSAPLAYQWRYNGSNLPGATTDVFGFSAVSGSDAGNYQVVITNAVGAVTSAVATLTVISDDPDGDGIPSSWEDANGTNPNVNDGGLDPDQDGFSNWQEYLAGTNPTNAFSALRLDIVSLQGIDVVLSFQAISNRSYTVEFSSFMSNGLWQKWQDIPGAPSNRTVWLTNGTGAASCRFYRLVTPLQP